MSAASAGKLGAGGTEELSRELGKRQVWVVRCSAGSLAVDESGQSDGAGREAAEQESVTANWASVNEDSDGGELWVTRFSDNSSLN